VDGAEAMGRGTFGTHHAAHRYRGGKRDPLPVHQGWCLTTKPRLQRIFVRELPVERLNDGIVR
jgi:hypothetical protein